VTDPGHDDPVIPDPVIPDPVLPDPGLPDPGHDLDPDVPDPYINSHGYDEEPMNMFGYSVPLPQSIDHEEHTFAPISAEFEARLAAFESGGTTQAPPPATTEESGTSTFDKAQGIADAWERAKTHAQQKVTHEILGYVPQFLGGNLGRDTSVKTI